MKWCWGGKGGNLIFEVHQTLFERSEKSSERGKARNCPPKLRGNLSIIIIIIIIIIITLCLIIHAPMVKGGVQLFL